MESVYYLVMLLGIAWLCIWSIVPEPYRRRLWWPFDMRDDADGATDKSGDNPADARPARLRRNGTGGTRDGASTTPAADLQHALPKPRPAQSWRVRREQAPPSRRGR